MSYLSSIGRRIRSSAEWQALTTDYISPTADVLAPGWRSLTWLAFEVALLIAVLVASAWAIGPGFVPFAQWVFYVALLTLLPRAAVHYARKRWGPDAPASVAALPMLLLLLPNVFIAAVGGTHLSSVKTLSSWSAWSYAVYACAVAILYWLAIAWRASMVRGMRAEADRQRERAEAAERDARALQARLESLQAQIEPSFLSDTLSRVQTLVSERPQEASTMLTNLIVEVVGRAQERKQLENDARRDSLTGLPNRRAFEELLAQEHKRAARDDEDLVVLFLDLNDFKKINDSLGHGAGDAVLREFATRIRSAVREADVVSRLGGDEFTILLHRPESPDAAAVVARKVEEALRPPLLLGADAIQLTASIGGARLRASQYGVDALLREADRAMYEDKARRKQAKANGPLNARGIASS